MDVPADLRYTREHVWVRTAAAALVAGITAHAQSELGDIVFVELPAAGSAVTAGKPFGVVESVKAVSDLFAPATGAVTRVNEDLAAVPELVNQDPYGKGWMIEIEPAGDPASGLMSAAEYRSHLADISG